MNVIVKTLRLLTFLLCTGQYAWASGACMITDFKGTPTLFNQKGPQAKIARFKKLWPDDTISVPKEAEIVLAYLALGRIEKWQGPALVTIGTNGSKDPNSNQQPMVTTLDKSNSYLEKSELLNAQNVAGQIAIRGNSTAEAKNLDLRPQGKRELHQLETAYHKLMQQTAPSDITAELYYLAGLEKLGQRETMTRHIHALLRKHGSNPELEKLLGKI